MEYYSAIKKNTFESVLMRWMKLERRILKLNWTLYFIKSNIFPLPVRKLKSTLTVWPTWNGSSFSSLLISYLAAFRIWYSVLHSTKHMPDYFFWLNSQYLYAGVTLAAAAKSLQSCPTLCDPIDGSPPGCPIPGILQARTGEGCHFLLQFWSMNMVYFSIY